MSVVNTIYTDTASFGRIMTDIKSVIGIFFGIIFIIGGFYVLLSLKMKRTSQTNAKISDITCNPSIKNGVTTYNCSFTATYTIDPSNANIKIPITTSSSTQYYNNENIYLYYDPTNPSDISIEQDNYTVLGWILIVVGIVVIISAIVSVYLAHRYKFFAAISAIDTAKDILSS